MNYNHLLLSSIPQKEKLLEYGFLPEGSCFVLRKKLDDEFYALITYDFKNLTAEVFETETEEKYALVEVKNASGSFVNGIRSKVNDLLNDITGKCFICTDLKTSYVDWLEQKLLIKGDFPFQDDNTSQVFRCSNSKWFALIMKIKFKNLGFESDEPVWAVNLKADPEKIPQIVDNRSIFPAWHMNKKYWITVILTSVTDFEVLKKLTLRSMELVEK